MTGQSLAGMVLLMAVALAATACSSSRSTRQDRDRLAPVAGSVALEPGTDALRIGMSQAEVRKRWGEPRDIASVPGAVSTERWVYETRKAAAGPAGTQVAKPVVQRTTYTLTFENGLLSRIDQRTY